MDTTQLHFTVAAKLASLPASTINRVARVCDAIARGRYPGRIDLDQYPVQARTAVRICEEQALRMWESSPAAARRAVTRTIKDNNRVAARTPAPKLLTAEEAAALANLLSKPVQPKAVPAPASAPVVTVCPPQPAPEPTTHCGRAPRTWEDRAHDRALDMVYANLKDDADFEESTGICLWN